MTEHEASRTLVKSPPELWAECSEAASLARHLGQFGEIRITKLEPETAVAWEGEVVRGTVRLEPSGWGTRVILTAAVEATEPEAGGSAVADAEAVDDQPAGPQPEPPLGFFARLARRLWGRREDRMIVASEACAAPRPEPEAPAVASVLDSALDSLGSAHHRPFSRA
jgi:hypothetical protein